MQIKETKYARVTPEEPGEFDCDDSYVVKLTGDAVKRTRIGPTGSRLSDRRGARPPHLAQSRGLALLALRQEPLSRALRSEPPSVANNPRRRAAAPSRAGPAREACAGSGSELRCQLGDELVVRG